MIKEYKNFTEFYPFYLSQHQNKVCRRLHFIGSSLVILMSIYVAITGDLVLLFLLPVIGYGFAWAGHFLFEKNKPATFIYPVYSLLGDWLMFKDILMGNIKF